MDMPSVHLIVKASPGSTKVKRVAGDLEHLI